MVSKCTDQALKCLAFYVALFVTLGFRLKYLKLLQISFILCMLFGRYQVTVYEILATDS
jgi:hypothetical protein